MAYFIALTQESDVNALNERFGAERQRQVSARDAQPRIIPAEAPYGLVVVRPNVFV